MIPSKTTTAAPKFATSFLAAPPNQPDWTATTSSTPWTAARWTSTRFTKEIAAHKPGDTVRVTVLRLGEFKEFPVTLKANPNPTYTLKLMEHPTDQQKAIYNSWLGIKQ